MTDVTDIASEPTSARTKGSALWITIEREGVRNALNRAVLEGIGKAIVSAASDPSIRAIVLTGAGSRAFCAGGDLKEGADAFARSFDDPQTDFGRLARIVRANGLPIIARVNGACVAGGMGLLALCDLAIAADHARFGLPEARVGVFPMQVLVHLRRMIAPRDLNWLCLTGELIGAAAAREMGLVNRVVGEGELDAAVEASIAMLAQCSPVALRRGKSALAAMEAMDFEAALSYAEAQISLASRTDDAQEGLAAFEARRPPRWTAATKEPGDG